MPNSDGKSGSKLDGQYDFMKNFNNEVRERNKTRKLKVHTSYIRVKRPKTKQSRLHHYTFIF